MTIPNPLLRLRKFINDPRSGRQNLEQILAHGLFAKARVRHHPLPPEFIQTLINNQNHARPEDIDEVLRMIEYDLPFHAFLSARNALE